MGLYWLPTNFIATSDLKQKATTDRTTRDTFPIFLSLLLLSMSKTLNPIVSLIFRDCKCLWRACVGRERTWARILPWLWRCRWCRRSHGWGCTRCARHCRSPHCCDNWAIDAPAADSPSTSELPPRRVLRPETRLGWSLASETQAPSSKALATM